MSYIDPSVTLLRFRDVPSADSPAGVPNASCSDVSVVDQTCCQPSYSYATILPLASTPAFTSARCAGPKLSQPCSSARENWTRTGAPTSFDTIAAACAAS